MCNLVWNDLGWDSINTCSTYEQAIGYVVEMAKVTETLQPPRTYVLWVVINESNNKVQKAL
jgi:hypothetical protein